MEKKTPTMWGFGPFQDRVQLGPTPTLTQDHVEIYPRRLSLLPLNKFCLLWLLGGMCISPGSATYRAGLCKLGMMGSKCRDQVVEVVKCGAISSLRRRTQPLMSELPEDYFYADAVICRQLYTETSAACLSACPACLRFIGRDGAL